MLPEGAFGDAFSGYQLVSTFELPPGADVFDVLADGRVIVLVDANVYVETAVRSRMLAFHGTLPDAPPLSFPSFVRVSPDGTRLAVGDGVAQVGVFALQTLAGDWFTAAHYDAEWYDNRYLALTGAAGGSVTRLDTESLDPANPVNPTIIVNKGVPGGITFDLGGNLYTANGYSESPPPETGDIKYFARAAWLNAAATSTPLDFINDGTLVVNLLSGASLGFDGEGNLHVGGGDFFGGTEVDYVGLVRAGALADAVAGQGSVDATDPTQVRPFDPDGANDSNFYAVIFNPTTKELLMQSFGETQVFVFVDVSSIPTVSAWGATVLVLLLLSAGTAVVRARAPNGGKTPGVTQLPHWV